MLFKYWWVLALTTSLALCVAAWFLATKQPTYFTSAKLNANFDGGIQLAGNNNSAATQDTDAFWAVQKQFITGKTVAQQTSDLLLARYPDMPPAPVSLAMAPAATIINLSASGSNPVYTQRWLQATIDSYLELSKQQRSVVTNQQLEKLNTQIALAEEAIKNDDAVMLKFQRDNNILLDKQGSTPAELSAAVLRDNLTHLRENADKYALMQTSPERAFERSTAPRAQSVNGGSGSDQVQAPETSATSSLYTDVRQSLARLQTDYDALSVDMRPAHPKLLALAAQIRSQKKQMQDLLDQSSESIDKARKFNAANIKAVELQLAETEKKVRDEALLKVEFSKLADQKGRDETNYNNLQVAKVTAARRGTLCVCAIQAPQWSSKAVAPMAASI